MLQYDKSVVPILESNEPNFSATEKIIAQFFIKNHKELDFSAKAIAQSLFVSEASLSRFAKKCGFQGYREFIYEYKNTLELEVSENGGLTRRVLHTYQELLNKSYSLISEQQLKKVLQMLLEYDHVFVYGIGSSALAAREFRIRFMRLGLHVEDIIDEHIMKMNGAILDEHCLVLGISLSSHSEIILDSLKTAKEKGAKTVLMTSNNDFSLHKFCDEILLVAITKNLEVGNVISPQFPILVVIDVLYSYFLYSDYELKSKVLKDTLEHIDLAMEEA